VSTFGRSRDVFSVDQRRRFIGDNKGRLRAVVSWRSEQYMDLSSEVPREQQCGQKKNWET
jgi:hypothetical protein